VADFFWHVKSCSLLEFYGYFGGTWRSFTGLRGKQIKQKPHIACLAYQSALKMNTVHSSEMSVLLNQTVWYHIQQGSTAVRTSNLTGFFLSVITLRLVLEALPSSCPMSARILFLRIKAARM
jgi:hypothetical protein